MSKLLVDAGRFCAGFHDAKVRGVKAKRVQVDEAWAFLLREGQERRDGEGRAGWRRRRVDWTAIEADTKLLISHFVGGRDGECAKWFIDDVADRRRDPHPAHVRTGTRLILEAVEGAFGADVDYAMLIKMYGNAPEACFVGKKC